MSSWREEQETGVEFLPEEHKLYNWTEKGSWRIYWSAGVFNEIILMSIVFTSWIITISPPITLSLLIMQENFT